MASGENKSKMDSLIKKREKYFARIQVLFDVGKKCIEIAQKKQSYQNELDSFISRYQRIEDDYAVYEQVNEDITALNSNLEDKDKIEVHNASMAYDEIYFNVKSLARKMQIDPPKTQTAGKTEATSTPNPHASPQVARLPKLEIQPFDGSIADWPNFYALFNSLIHKNQALSNSEKLTYLRSLLKSHALSLIENLVISEENYDIALHQLIQRYQNKRLLASNYLDKVFSFRAITEDTSNSLTSFIEVFKTNLSALKALGIDDLFDFTMLHFALRVLTPSTRKDFENDQTDTNIPKFESLVNFIEQRLRVLEITNTAVKHKQAKTQNKPFSSKSTMLSTTVNNDITNKKPLSSKCPYCQDTSHKIYGCAQFKGLTVCNRNDFAKKNSLCYCCLGFHRISDCKSKSRCLSCSGKHHTLLHRQKEYSISQHDSSSKPSDNVSLSSNDTVAKTCSFANSNTSSNMVLSTAVIGIRDQHGSLLPIKALIDGGSQTSLITEDCASKLNLKRHSNNVNITGVAETSIPLNKGSVHCSISPLENNSIVLSTDAIVVPKIASNQPNVPIDSSIRSKFIHLKLADPSFDVSSPIEFLLGADLYFDILQESNNLIKGEPSAMATIFGWVIGGRVPNIISSKECSSLLICNPSLDATLTKFWEVESVNTEIKPNPEDQVVEEMFLTNHRRDDHGRYVVSLPIKPNAPLLPNTRDEAKKRLVNLEYRLKTNSEMYEEYRSFMDDYIAQGHMSICPEPSSYIIPHHCIRKEDSSTTKLRTVFNASYKPRESSTSLNDILHSGPKLQRDITEVITNFRLHSIVICADIKQMYRNVVVTEEHRKYQHIFYRTKINGAIEEYELNVLTYGVTSSAFLAQRVLLQLVHDEGYKYPLASKAIINQTFVDDICVSVETVTEALCLQQELIDLLKLGGFKLHKWSSNCKEVLQKVSLDHREKPLKISTKDEQYMKVLGVQYNPDDDTFSYTIFLNPLVYTKRSMLSEMSKIYDILGWITPCTFYVKHLMQSLWLLGLGWDDPLPTEICNKWETFISSLPELSQMKIPRHLPIASATTFQIIGFCDASEKGYAANLYLRTEHGNGVSIHILKGKSKVAPLKVISIPRLELCAAQLLVHLLVSVNALIQTIEPKEIVLFTDSTVVIHWLRTPPHKLKTFVANRVVDILQDTNPSQWRHVKSKDNPCDIASRGALPKDLLKCDLWWKGPQFLYEPISNQPIVPEVYEDLPEIKLESLMITRKSPNILLGILEKSSSLTKAKLVLAMIVRFTQNLKLRKARQTPLNGPITPKEQKNALMMYVKVTQECYLSKEIERMKNETYCTPKYRPLALFLDVDELVRVGGRLKDSLLPYSAKHPVLIPQTSRLATLICDHYHILSLHGGPRLTQSLIQRQFWIVGIRQLLRERIFRCNKCYLFQAKPITPKMANLPPVRFECVRAFLNVGLDYAGPFDFKEGTRRKAPTSKGYIVIFVCLATKAVHLEFATSLSTISFLAALDRFVARRGLCKQIYSDCGTNFKGASNHYLRIKQFLHENGEYFAQNLSKKDVKWIFIPPAAPNFGGIWEAAVKSTKRHISRILVNLNLTYEEMSTLLYRIEAVLNSRPLGPMTTDPNDGDYLSPGHFLVGAPLISPPEIDYTESPVNRLTRYELLQQAAQAFWKAWSRDYLHTLMSLNKWTTTQPNVKVGDVVYLQLKNTSPLEWPLGRIISTFPGRDGIVRAVKIKTPQGIFTRPVNKLISLPPHDTNL